MKKVIWSSEIDLDEWKEFIEEEKENGRIAPEDNGYMAVWEQLTDYLEDEKMNLDVPLAGRILVIGDIGRWNGRQLGVKIIDTKNVNAIFDGVDIDYSEWWFDGYNIRGKEAHHDGTNFYEFREIREDRDIDNLICRVRNGKELTRQAINYYTKSIAPHVKKVYGW